jgi:2-polyprenyl-3-methyl-5-hydroxy-6-metoxy-1,4-benzoquinol methylase
MDTVSGRVRNDDLNGDALAAGPDLLSTTRFFRNRPQHRQLLCALRGSAVLVVGASRGCEAYALAVEAELASRRLDITAIDLDKSNVRRARANRFSAADFVDFDGYRHLDDRALSRFFEFRGDAIKVDMDAIGSSISFEWGNLFAVQGPWDAILCNNVLIHFKVARAAQALRHLAGAVAPGGVLAIGGVDIGLLARVAPSLGLVPIVEDIDAIWDGWKGDRLTFEQDPDRYVSMPPLDRALPDWRYRFATLFRIPGGS